MRKIALEEHFVTPELAKYGGVHQHRGAAAAVGRDVTSAA